MKQYIITALCSIIFSVTFSPLNGMELEVQDSKFESLFKNHVKYEQYESAIVKMSKTARRNCNFEYVQKLVWAMRNNQEINDIIKDYKVNKAVGNSIISSRVMSDVESAQALLRCKGNVYDSIYIHNVVENGSITLLKLLKKNQKVKFNNPELIKTALGTKELARINFVLDQQENNDQLPRYYQDILKLVPKNCILDIFKELDLADKDKEFEIAQEMYTHLLNGRNGNIKPLEYFVLDFYDDMQQLRKVQILFELNFKEMTFDKEGSMVESEGKKLIKFYEIPGIICTYPEGIKAPFELNSNAVNNIKEITFNALRIMNKYQKFSDELIKKKWSPVAKYTYRLARKALTEYKDHIFLLRRPNALMGFFSGCIFAAKDIDSNRDGVLAAGILPLAWYIKKLYTHFKERNEKYLYAKNILATHKNINYLEGYMDGLLSKNGQIENRQENSQEQYYENNLYESNLLIKILPMMPLFQTFLLPLIIFDPSLMKLVALTIVSLPMFIESLQSGKSEIKDDLDKLLDCVYKRGERDGWIQRNSDQLQLNQQQNEQIPVAKSSSFKTIFGGIISYSRNLFSGFKFRIQKITWRNPNLQK